MEQGASSSRPRKRGRKTKRIAEQDASPATETHAETTDYRPSMAHLNSGTLPPITIYPFNSPYNMTSHMLERREVLKNYEIINPIYPDDDTLQGHDLLEPVKGYFEKVGLGFIFDGHFGVYEDLVREFAYSFMPFYTMRPASETESGQIERYIHGWKFQIGNTEFLWPYQDIRRVFNVREELVKYPFCGSSVWDSFWKELSGSDDEFVSSPLASQIKSPIWKVIHRLIATAIYLRPDGGRFVTKDDYTLMCCMRAEIPIDPVIIITKALVIPKRRRGKFIGGGHIISMIAIACHFDISRGISLPRRWMQKEEFERRGLAKIRDPSATLPSGVEDRPRPSQGRSQTGPSSAPPAPTGYEELTSMMRSLTTYTQDGFRWQGEMAVWQGNMMRNIHTQLNIPGFVEPPSWAGGQRYTGLAAAIREPRMDSTEEEQDDSD